MTARSLPQAGEHVRDHRSGHVWDGRGRTPIGKMPNAGSAAGNAALDPLPITSVSVTQP